jgi:hypothetical protein
MNVSRQTNVEARRILFTETSCQIGCTSLRYRKEGEDGWYYSGRQTWQWVVSNFRNIRLEITIYPPDGPRSIPDFDPGHYIGQVFEVLKTTNHVCEHAALVKIDMLFIVIASGNAYFELNPSKWPDWASESIRNAVTRARDDILKENFNIKITTNADSAPAAASETTPTNRGWGFLSS